MVIQALSFSPWEVEAGRSLSSRPAKATVRPWLKNKETTTTKKKKQTNKTQNNNNKGKKIKQRLPVEAEQRLQDRGQHRQSETLWDRIGKQGRWEGRINSWLNKLLQKEVIVPNKVLGTSEGKSFLFCIIMFYNHSYVYICVLVLIHI